MTATLTPSQHYAVRQSASVTETLVIAGAGSGKTRVLTERVVHLITQTGLSASDLLVLTFTRKAAGELRGRVAAALRARCDGGADAQLSAMMLGTFHSVALQILRLFGARLGYHPASMTVIDEDDATLLLMQVCKDLGYIHGKAWRHGLSMKLVRRHIDAIYTGQDHDGGAEAGRIFSEYQSRMFAMNVMDFGSILASCNRLFEHHPDVLFIYRDRFKAVLVDELQDSDAVQYRLHEWFAPTAMFFGVGDTRQTIYRFRGARPDLMRKQHPSADVINLRECFRCGDRIVEAANSLIAFNGDDLAKPMIGATGFAGAVECLSGRSRDIVAALGDLHASGYAWSDIAVMARSHRQLKRIGEVCAEKKIPFHRVGASFDVCVTDAFRALHAALRLVVNPKDDLAFMRLQGPLGLSQEKYAQIRKLAASARRSHFEAYRAMVARSSLWVAFNECMTPADDEGPALTVHQVAVRIVAAMEDAELAKYSAPVAFWLEHCTKMTVVQALRWFTLRDCHDDVQANSGRVTLLTVHAAKGLEWPCVIVAGLNEKTFPSSQSIREGSVDDERRLAYVAFTRAKERLILHYRRKCDQSQDRRPQARSRFLGESGVMQESLLR